jgi:transcriptional regulator with XRE-family HTH domain
MSIARKLVDLREQLGMTQQDLRKATGVAQATISRIERGVLPHPKLDVLRRLAEALNVTVDYLADRTEEMGPSDVVSADPRAQAIFRGYQELSDDQKTALVGLVQYLQKEKKRKQKERGG